MAAQRMTSATASHQKRADLRAGSGIAAIFAITASVKSSRGSMCVSRTSVDSTVARRPANDRHRAHDARCASTSALSRAESSPSCRCPRRDLHAEQFTAAYLRSLDRREVARVVALFVESAGERGLAAMDQRFDVAERYLHRVGDLLIFHVSEVPERERCAHFFWNLSERV